MRGGAQSHSALEGIIVREIRVTGLSKLSPGDVERHLATRVGEPFHQATLLLDRRRLDELRLFADVSLQPRLDNEGVILEVTVSETLRVLPVVVIRVTDENGISAGPGVRTINLLGHRAQFGGTLRFGGETAVAVTADSTTITPGARAWHVGFSDSSRRNELYDFDEHATTVDARLSRNWKHGLRTGGAAEVMALDTGTSGASLSPDGTDVITTVGGFITVDTLDSSTDPRAGTWAEFQIDRLLGDASSWTFTVDGRRFQRLSARHGLGLFSLASLQTGEVGNTLPEYLQYALGGGNSVRGWDLGARRGRNQFIGTFEYTYVACPVSAFTVAGVNLYVGAADGWLRRPRARVEQLGRLQGRVRDRRLRPRTPSARAVRRRHPDRRRMGRAGTRRHGVLWRVAQSGAPAPARAIGGRLVCASPWL